MSLWYRSNNTGRIVNDLERVLSPENRLQEFDDFILTKLHGPPGLDASYNIKLKSFDDNALPIPPDFVIHAPLYKKLFTMIDLCLKAMTTTLLLEHFQVELDEILQRICPLLFRENIKNELSLKAFGFYIKSKLYDHEQGFRKYYRDRRSQMLNNWLDIATLRPQYVVLDSFELDGLSFNGSPNSIVFPSRIDDDFFGFMSGLPKGNHPGNL